MTELPTLYRLDLNKAQLVPDPVHGLWVFVDDHKKAVGAHPDLTQEAVRDYLLRAHELHMLALGRDPDKYSSPFSLAANMLEPGSTHHWLKQAVS